VGTVNLQHAITNGNLPFIILYRNWNNSVPRLFVQRSCRH